jgi:hypothetical protein
LVKNIGKSATAQVVTFLEQWKSFVELRCSEVHRTANGQLENLCANADTLCESLGIDADLSEARDSAMLSELSSFQKETHALKSELNSTIIHFKEEESRVKNEILSLKNRTIDTSKKAISMYKDVRSHSSKQANKELLNALRVK